MSSRILRFGAAALSVLAVMVLMAFSVDSGMWASTTHPATVVSTCGVKGTLPLGSLAEISGGSLHVKLPLGYRYAGIDSAGMHTFGLLAGHRESGPSSSGSMAPQEWTFDCDCDDPPQEGGCTEWISTEPPYSFGCTALEGCIDCMMHIKP